MSNIIDINVTPVVEQVEITVTENLTTVNINTVSTAVERFPTNSPNSTVTVGGALAETALADRTAIDVLTEILIAYLYPQFTAKACLRRVTY